MSRRSGAHTRPLRSGGPPAVPRPFARTHDAPATLISTDMGNVSLRMPAIHPALGIDSLPAVNHQPEFAEATVTPAADQALYDGALALAWTAIDLASEPSTRDRLLSRGRS